MNAGRWQLLIKSLKRLFLDYIVLIPSDYYLGSGLTELVQQPCEINSPRNKSCIELLYPPLPATIAVDAYDLSKFRALDTAGIQTSLDHTPEQDLPLEVGQGVLVKTDFDHSKEIIVEIIVLESSIYHLLVEYHNNEFSSMPVKVRIEQSDNTAAEGILLINHCPYV